MISSLSLLSGKQPLKKRRCKEICTEKEKGGVKSKVYRYIIVWFVFFLNKKSVKLI